MRKVLLRELAWARSGDKGDISDLGIMAFNEKNYEILKRQITPEKVKAFFKNMVKGNVEVYEMPNLLAIKVVMRNALGGGATKTLRWDETGKAMATAILRMEVEVPE
jgi:hypothetical protein